MEKTLNQIITEENIQLLKREAAYCYEYAIKTHNMAERYKQFQLANAFTNVVKAMLKLDEKLKKIKEDQYE